MAGPTPRIAQIALKSWSQASTLPEPGASACARGPALLSGSGSGARFPKYSSCSAMPPYSHPSCRVISAKAGFVPLALPSFARASRWTVELVHVLDVALVQLEVVLQQSVGDSRQSLQPRKALRFVPFHAPEDAHGAARVRRALALFVRSLSTERSRDGSVRAETGVLPGDGRWTLL